MGVTSPDSLPWPVGTAVPDGPLAFQNLATATQTALTAIRAADTAAAATGATHLIKSGTGGMRVYRVDSAGGSTDATGMLTVTHTPPFTPTFVQVFGRAPGSSFAYCIGTDTYTATSFRSRWASWGVGGALVSTPTGAFTAIYWE